MVKKRNRYTRKRRVGGAKGETMKFMYTTNPLRAGWTEAIYPLAPFFLQIPAQINWSSYSYEGPTIINVLDLQNNNNNNNEDKDDRRSYTVKATPNIVPYTIFGGSACELYNSVTIKSSFKIDDLHKTTDPTGDMDVRLINLDIKLTHPEEIEPAEKDFIRSVVMFDSKEGGLTKLYDHYTSWLFDRIVELVTPISKQLKAPDFFPKGTQGNSELVNADKIQQVGNLLVTRAIINNMIKIQCGVGVNTPSGPIQDHIFEFILSLNNFVKLDSTTHKTPENPQLAIYQIPVSIGSNHFNLFIEHPATLLNGQAKGFVDRIPLRNKPALIHKLYNHYGRLLYCLQLVIWARAVGMPPSKYTKFLFPNMNKILDEGLLDLTPSPCPKQCNKKFITDLYEMILTM